MNKLILLTLFSLFSICCCAQTSLKANILYWSFGITNISAETKLSNKLTLNSELVYSPWKSIKGNHFEFLQISPEVRFFTKEAFNGFYVGGYGSFQAFDITKWNYWNKNKHQKGRGFSLGVSVGYEYKINNKLGMDVYAGGGWQNSQYRGYNTKTGEKYVGWNGSGEWLPYKVGIAIFYKL